MFGTTTVVVVVVVVLVEVVVGINERGSVGGTGNGGVVVTRVPVEMIYYCGIGRGTCGWHGEGWSLCQLSSRRG